MNLPQQFAAAGIEVTRQVYDDGVVLAADFGPAADATVDVVGDTIIVVAGDEQYEFDLSDTVDADSGADAQAVFHNGVLTIEVNG